MHPLRFVFACTLLLVLWRNPNASAQQLQLLQNDPCQIGEPLFESDATMLPDGTVVARCFNDGARLVRFDPDSVEPIEVLTFENSGISTNWVRLLFSSSAETFVAEAHTAARTPIRWSNGTVEELACPLTPPAGSCVANDLSSDGSIAVGTLYASGAPLRPLIWHGTDLSVLPEIAQSSSARLISGDGSVVVGTGEVPTGGTDILGNPEMREAMVRWVDGAPHVVQINRPDVSEPLSDTGREVPVAISHDGSTILSEVYYWTWDAQNAVSLNVLMGIGFRQNGGFEMIGPTVTDRSDEPSRPFPLALSGDGTTVLGRVQNEGFLWTRESGVRTLREMLEQDFAFNVSNWTEIIGIGLSHDGRYVYGYLERAGELRTHFRMDRACTDTASKQLAECECTAAERTWIGDFVLFDEVDAWENALLPGNEDVVLFPRSGERHQVLMEGSHQIGSLAVDGMVQLVGNGAPTITLSAPCGEALSVSSETQTDTTSGQLHLIQGVELEALGTIWLPALSSSYAVLRLSEASAVTSEAEINAYWGSLPGSGATVEFLGGASWDTPAGDVTVGAAHVIVDQESEVRLRRLYYGVGDNGSTLPLYVRGNALLQADSLSGGWGMSGASLLLEGSELEVNGLVAGVESRFDVVISDSAEAFVGEAVIGKQDSSNVSVQSGLLTVEDQLVIGADEGGAGQLDVLPNGDLHLPGITHVGDQGAGILSVLQGAGLNHADGVPGLLYAGAKDGSDGSVILYGDPADTSPGLDLSLMAMGQAGVGRIDLYGYFLRVDYASLGVLEGGDGTMGMFQNGRYEGGTMIVGDQGRGSLEMRSTSTLRVGRLGVGKKNGGFGSVHVSDSASAQAAVVCVGCEGGFGIVGVDGTLATDLLRVGPLGTVRGATVNVRTETAQKTAADLAPGTIVTGALYLAAESVVEADSIVVEDGTLGGTATWPSDFVNAGTVAPGDSAGALGVFSVNGRYEQAESAALVVDLAAEESDRLDVTGPAVLNGTLRIELAKIDPPDDLFVRRIQANDPPEPGSRFVILSADEVSGAFSRIETAEEIEVRVEYEPQRVIVEVTSFTPTHIITEPDLPSLFVLEANYPNPFNPTTTIGFVLPESRAVRLEVVDVFGRLVRVLVDETMPAGRHEVNFKATDLASGAYVYRIRAGDYSASRTMVLLK